MKNMTAELATKKLYNWALFDLTNKNYDLNKITDDELNKFYLIQYAENFKEFINQAIADDDELFDYCISRNIDYKTLYNKIEEQGFNLV